MVFLDQHGISRYTDLEQKSTELQDSNEQTAAALKTAERRLSDLALLIKHTATYKELKPLYSEYKKSRDKEKYLRGHEREIILLSLIHISGVPLSYLCRSDPLRQRSGS